MAPDGPIHAHGQIVHVIGRRTANEVGLPVLYNPESVNFIITYALEIVPCLDKLLILVCLIFESLFKL